jgi:hypothetical protein
MTALAYLLLVIIFTLVENKLSEHSVEIKITLRWLKLSFANKFVPDRIYWPAAQQWEDPTPHPVRQGQPPFQHISHGLINYLDTISKMSSSKKLTCKWTLRQMFICLRPPPLLGFCLEWSSNFVGSESGQTQSVKLLHNMVSNRTHHPTTPSQPHTVCIYCTSTQGRGGGESWTRERVRGATVHKAGSKIPT